MEKQKIVDEHEGEKTSLNVPWLDRKASTEDKDLRKAVCGERVREERK
jgi:hypothetical protein